MTAHPYPKKVMECVAVAIFEHYNRSDGLDITAVDTAEVALSALWEASRVDDVDQLPDDAVYLNDLGGIGFVGADRNTHMVDHMEHIIHWGDEL